MTGGRPRTPIGTYGTISIRQRGKHFVAETRFRDLDGRLRKVNATATSRSVARTTLKERVLPYPRYKFEYTSAGGNSGQVTGGSAWGARQETVAERSVVCRIRASGVARTQTMVSSSPMLPATRPPRVVRRVPAMPPRPDPMAMAP